MALNLNPKEALIFRIVHLANLAWILDHGMHCRNSPFQDPHYFNIGSAELIEKRSRRAVPIAPGGTLSDYVPFYFTPFSIMMYNIKTGYGGITKRENKELVILVSSVHKLRELGLPFVFTNQHSYPVDTLYYSQIEDLKNIDWTLLNQRDFKTSDDDPGKQSRYQAEALVHGHVPLKAMLGVGCWDDTARGQIELLIKASQDFPVRTRPKWYF